MIDHFRYLDIPPLTDDLVQEILKVVDQNKNNLRAGKGFSAVFIKEGKLLDYAKQTFGPTYSAHVQFLKGNVVIHQDKGRLATNNYLIQAGGPAVRTRFYTDFPECEPVDEFIIEENKWHWINTEIYHNVMNIQDSVLRIAFSCFEHFDKKLDDTPIVSKNSEGIAITTFAKRQ